MPTPSLTWAPVTIETDEMATLERDLTVVANRLVQAERKRGTKDTPANRDEVTRLRTSLDVLLDLRLTLS